MLDTHGSNKLIKKLYNYKKLTSIYEGLNETIKHDYK